MARGFRVVAGGAKGVPLAAPPGARPTSGRVREALFSAIGDVTGAAVLDLFAGSGSLAVEALSRGARGALLVERDRRAAATCAHNLDVTRATDRGRVVTTSVGSLLRGLPVAEAPFDLVFIDPPYGLATEEVGDVLDELRRPGWLAPGARVVVERPARRSFAAPPGWEAAWERKHGDTLVVVLREQD
jgi:16S rRNA (guanine966-N2)-methyltransferase